MERRPTLTQYTFIWQCFTRSELEEKVDNTTLYTDTPSRRAYNGDTIRCFATKLPLDMFGTRVNTTQNYYAINQKVNVPMELACGHVISYFHLQIFKIWTQLFDGKGPSLISPNSTIKSTQIVECAVGDGTVIAEKTSLKNSVLGRNCQVIEKVRISDSVLMNGVVIEERWVENILTDTFFHYYRNFQSGSWRLCGMRQCGYQIGIDFEVVSDRTQLRCTSGYKEWTGSFDQRWWLYGNWMIRVALKKNKVLFKNFLSFLFLWFTHSPVHHSSYSEFPLTSPGWTGWGNIQRTKIACYFEITETQIETVAWSISSSQLILCRACTGNIEHIWPYASVGPVDLHDF